MRSAQGRVFIIAGSDSGGGAGIQADIKTVTALRGYAATAVTAVTAQNTLGVRAIHDVPSEIIGDQIDAVLQDIGADCIKTGMLPNAEVISLVCDRLEALAPDIPIIVDPVMIATSGDRLVDESALSVLKSRLLPGAALITPNIPEAELLTGMHIGDLADMRRAAAALCALGPRAVLLTGGHLPGAEIHDLLFAGGAEVEILTADKIKTRNTHGTGCTLASAIATGVAQGLQLVQAVRRARDFVRKAIETAPGLGTGHGPLNHGHTFSHDPQNDP